MYILKKLPKNQSQGGYYGFICQRLKSFFQAFNKRPIDFRMMELPGFPIHSCSTLLISNYIVVY